MMKKSAPLCSLIAVLAATAASLGAQDTPPNSSSLRRATVSPAGETVKRADSNFIEKAAQSGKDAVIISQIAVARAVTPAVKEFAQAVVNDHGSANTQLAQLASHKGVTLPRKEPSAQKWNSKKEGKAFDEDYLEKMVAEHGDAVDFFQKGAKSSDPEIAAFASSVLPTLQAHLAKAKEIKKSLK